FYLSCRGIPHPHHSFPTRRSSDLEAAEAALAEFEAGIGQKHPAVVRLWRDAWEVFVPFLAFPAEIRRVVYTTNMIESINYQLRKDRKSTRLNSSHVKISYAVFCLK